MTPKQSIEWVKSFEKSLKDVNHRFYGVDIWPIARNSILSRLNSTNDGRSVVKYGSRFKAFLSGASLALASLRCLIKKRHADVFVLSDRKYSEEIGGQIYLNDAHAISEIIEARGESTVIGLQGMFADDRVVAKRRCISVYAVTVISAALSRFNLCARFFPGLTAYSSNLLRSVNEHLETGGSDRCGLTEKQFVKNIVFCLVATRIFSFMLKRFNPSRAYVVCYYSLLGMAFCAACHHLGIPVSDVQHGVSGRYVRAYSSWSQCPSGGYTTLPDRFLTWTKYDSSAINWTMEYGCRMHQAVTSGPLWDFYKRKVGLHAESTNEWSDFISAVSGYPHRIVVTLQSSFVSPAIKELVESSSPERCFLIRAHPNFNKGLVMNDLIAFCEKHKHVYVVEPSKIPIRLLMSIADINITGWSASVYDAYFEGVPSIIFSPTGRDYFSDFIQNGLVVYASHLKTIDSYIASLSKFRPFIFDYEDFHLDIL